ncbi:hypothetical protein FF36_05120 [Frankia torreyi]|uniref:Pyridoxamine 5'-phosphate oxidase n=1 Tax=Frankia torreyi TaxID=1856 RepID=A0A0D8B923_9ACTN|nr:MULTISPECIES: hypothetical protein [Frankia]KJE20615.1 hypothetical protein FF36_05120 [Frankia torreyi]KQC36609.1 hypothetical protein UK82_19575 [Frankia sp. ACN1ag]KQM02907.1 hypothetical protein FF86_10525 [Frankia sp. CpI1-P]
MPAERRRRIAMGDEQLSAFLDGSAEMVVAYVNADGWPVGTLAGAERHGEEITVEFTDPTGTATGIGVGEAVCCVAEEGVRYDEIRGAIVRGEVTVAATVAGRHRWTVRERHTSSFDFAALADPGPGDAG